MTLKGLGLPICLIFHDLEESDVLLSYMSDAIEDISKARAALEMKEAAPLVAGITYLNLKVIVIC
jgi:exocyst complex component 2